MRRISLFMVGIAVCVVLTIWGAVYFFGPLDTVPRPRASAKSPDGLLSVHVVKKRKSLIPLRVVLIARIYDSHDSLVFEKQIFEDGWWTEDIGEMYSKVLFVGDEIRIGPGYSAEEYLVIKRSELKIGKEAAN